MQREPPGRVIYDGLLVHWFHRRKQEISLISILGKRMRKAITRRTVDYNATLVAHLEVRIFIASSSSDLLQHRVTQKFERDVPVVQPWASYIRAVRVSFQI